MILPSPLTAEPAVTDSEGIVDEASIPPGRPPVGPGVPLNQADSAKQGAWAEDRATSAGIPLLALA